MLLEGATVGALERIPLDAPEQPYRVSQQEGSGVSIMKMRETTS